MKWGTANLQTRLYLISAIILMVGLSSAILIYLSAGDDSDSAAGYEVVDGHVYPTTTENSKTYVHDLELFGGKSAVLASEFRHWFVGLWQGKSLAFTVAGISIIIFIGVFYVAYHSPSNV